MLHHVQQSLGSGLSSHNGVMNSLTRQWVNVSRSVTNDDKKIIEPSLNALSAEAERCSLHALDGSIRSDSTANKGVLRQSVVVKTGKV